MVVTSAELRTELEPFLRNGKQVMLRYFTISYGAGSYYDDSDVLTHSGNDVWTSGLHMPLSARYGSEDFHYVEQGRLSSNDSKLYVLGDIETSAHKIKIAIGSPLSSTNIYKLKSESILSYPLDEPVYKKMFITKILGNGSLTGES